MMLTSKMDLNNEGLVLIFRPKNTPIQQTNKKYSDTWQCRKEKLGSIACFVLSIPPYWGMDSKVVRWVQLVSVWWVWRHCTPFHAPSLALY